MKKIELLVDVCDFNNFKEIIKTEVDSVCIGDGLKKFSLDEIKEAVKITKNNNKKIYLAFNKIPHEKDAYDIKIFLEKIKGLEIDGIYVLEPGTLKIVKETLRDVKVFFSEQANITNYETANFWYNEGVKRVVVSKELSIKDITNMINNIYENLEVELLVHGSLLISHSGRKLLSNFIKDKSGSSDYNLDEKYNLVEEQRPNMYFPVYEDERGTFLFNTEDMCMIEYIPELIRTNAKIFKIDTRLKDTSYTIEVIKAYKKAIDEFYNNPDEWKFNEEWLKNLDDLNSRNFTSGFYIKKA